LKVPKTCAVVPYILAENVAPSFSVFGPYGCNPLLGHGSTAGCHPESIATLPPFGPIEGQKLFDQISANESPRRTGLHLSLLAKAGLNLPPFEISCS
jgi:hypothetical protein